MPEKLNQIRPRKKNMMLVSVTNNKTCILGYIDVCFFIGTTQFTHTFSVAEGIAEDLIIGRDFLIKFSCCFWILKQIHS